MVVRKVKLQSPLECVSWALSLLAKNCHLLSTLKKQWNNFHKSNFQPRVGFLTKCFRIRKGLNNYFFEKVWYKTCIFDQICSVGYLWATIILFLRVAFLYFASYFLLASKLSKYEEKMFQSNSLTFRPVIRNSVKNPQKIITVF